MFLPKLSPESVKLLSDAAEESTKAGHHYLGVEHLFLGLAENVDTKLCEALAAQGVEIPLVRRMLHDEVAGESHRPWGEEMIYTPRCHAVLQLAGRIAARRKKDAVAPAQILEALFREGRSVPLRVLRNLGADLISLQGVVGGATVVAEPEAAKTQETATPLLDRYGSDLTELARSGRVSQVIGRQREQDLLQEVLLRKNKNNPVLVGEAGVGKTAIVEGFAQRINEPACPEPFRECRIVELSMAAIVAGTKYRGQFEERLLGIVEEARENPNVILFLDEIHTLVGAGSSGGDTLDAGNILKPSLARGEIRIIGATTIAEYRRCIEKDPALERRFDKIHVEEPHHDEASEILFAVAPSLEEHHQVEISDDAIEAALDLTVRHVPDRRLPDKALDALDQSCARRRLRSLRKVDSGELQHTPTVTARDISETVAQWTGIPLKRLSGESLQGLLNLKNLLKKRVIGQDHAVEAVAKSVLTARAGLASDNRPVGVFLFLGPTGVGKTELAKSLAELLFGEEKRLIRFDMSEYSEAHSAAKLIGAPPGYVGYEEEGLLISSVRTHPHSVVLFDEIEKAHPQLFDLFLQIFDEGTLTGAHGKSADFTHAVVILTSNLAVLQPEEGAKVGFPSAGEEEEEQQDTAGASDLRRALTQFLRPELVNRIDEVLQFNTLGPKSLRKIIDHYIGELEEKLAGHSIELRLDDAVYDVLMKLGDSDTFGARELRRVVDHEIRQPLAEHVLRAEAQQGVMQISVEDGKLRFVLD
ncbi:MAG: ATP-dependent Clp protease ATP-binding subunit [Planctomycetota bacterium]